jgi:hypothetical protein
MEELRRGTSTVADVESSFAVGYMTGQGMRGRPLAGGPYYKGVGRLTRDFRRRLLVSSL